MDWQKLHDTCTPEERLDILFHMLQRIDQRQNRRSIKRFGGWRARAYWLGGRRPRRLERPLLFIIIVIAALILELDQYLLWLSVWSGGAAVLINFSAAYKMIPRKRYHWAGRRR